MNDKPGSFGHPSQPWPGDYLLVAHWLHLFFGNGLSTFGFYCAERTMLIQAPLVRFHGMAASSFLQLMRDHPAETLRQPEREGVW